MKNVANSEKRDFLRMITVCEKEGCCVYDKVFWFFSSDRVKNAYNEIYLEFGDQRYWN